MALSVRIPKALEQRFKKAAKEAFPNEEYAILLGQKRSAEVFEVVDLYFPPDRDKFCTDRHVDIQPRWFKEARKLAQEAGYRLIGDLHSHPYTKMTDASPSECDWDASEYPKGWTNGSSIVMGICLVVKRAGKWYSRVRFWPTFRPLRKKVV